MDADAQTLRTLTREIERRLDELALVEDPLGDGDYYLVSDGDGSKTIRLVVYFCSFSEESHAAIVSALREVATDFVVRVGFVERSAHLRVPDIEVSSDSRFSKHLMSDYLHKHGGQLDLRKLVR